MKSLLIIVSLSLLIFACEQNTPPVKRPKVDLFPQLQLNTLDLNYDKSSDYIEDDFKTEYKRLNQSIYQFHRTKLKKLSKVSKIDLVTIRKKIESLESYLSVQFSHSPINLSQLKKEIQKKLSDDNTLYVDPLYYQKETGSFLSAFLTYSQNSYASTYLFLYLLRQITGEESFKKHNLVVVSTYGHLFPGYMVYNPDSEAWNLYGIEMLSMGEGIISYGDPNDLDIEVKVLLADDFLRLDRAYEDDRLKTEDFDSKITEAKNRVKQCYQFDYELKENDSKSRIRIKFKDQESRSNLTDLSFLGFGELKVKDNKFYPLEAVSKINYKNKKVSYLPSYLEMKSNFTSRRHRNNPPKPDRGEKPPAEQKTVWNEVTFSVTYKTKHYSRSLGSATFLVSEKYVDFKSDTIYPNTDNNKCHGVYNRYDLLNFMFNKVEMDYQKKYSSTEVFSDTNEVHKVFASFHFGENKDGYILYNINRSHTGNSYYDQNDSCEFQFSYVSQKKTDKYEEKKRKSKFIRDN